MKPFRSRAQAHVKRALIVNPASGSGLREKDLAYVLRFFERRGQALRIFYTEYPGHATGLARKAAEEGCEVVIGAGGDGTINEVLNGLVGTGAKLGVIPWGTGNVFAREMGFPRGVKRLCRVLWRNRSLRLDLGKADGRYFLLMCGAGLDAYALSQHFDPGRKSRLGILSYFVMGLRALVRYRYPEIEAILPGGRVERCSFALVSNTSRYGPFFTLSPRADPLDGELDVFLYRQKGTLSTLRLAAAVIAGAVLGRDPLKRRPFRGSLSFRTAALELRSAGQVRLQLDGDPAGSLPLRIEVSPHTLSCVLPWFRIRLMLRRTVSSWLFQ